MKYETVPYIFTTKDLAYLKDIFAWNHGAFKTTVNAINCVDDEELSLALKSASNTFKENMETIIEILSEGPDND